MAERIYLKAEDGTIEPLQEKAFDFEDELQTLIAEHPELLDGEQMRPGDPRRWLLITREKGIAETAGEGARWAVDHLLVDQDARPTLAEVKRGWNSELRRTVVGQVLDYAAYASETWTAQHLRELFETSAAQRGVDSQGELDRLLQKGAEADADAFWDEVQRNLDANRLRLLFVSDRIPDELARVVTFLNEQMPNIEVLAVEIKRFQGETNQTLVPRVIGRSTRRTPGSRAGGTRATRESFLAAFADESVRDVATALLRVAHEAGAKIEYGRTGPTIRVACEGIRQPITVAWLYPKKGIQWNRTREFSFGAALYKHPVHGDIRSHVQGYLDELRTADYMEDATSEGVQAWAIAHEFAVERQGHLEELLKRIIKGFGP